MAKCEAYLGQEIGYRQGVQEQGLPTVYDQPPAGIDPSAALAPSTLWRWLSWLGSLPGTLQRARQLIHEKDASVTLHREAWAVSPAKYASEARHQILRQALQLLVVDRVFQELFGKAIFPNLATGCGWS